MGAAYKGLVVWQKAIELCTETYRQTSTYPAAEQYGLMSQMRRASVSSASNIAEGYGRATQGEYVLFLGHARGSNCELQTQLIISENLGFGSASSLEKAMNLSEDTSRRLIAMMKKLLE